ncbi:methyl-accepting chemotaxis protein [Paenibacillus pabuli]|uniref:methyl-accepting chemotaxis protein n=1 Tax=Paenibacillus pabuli TaxID=1472 RepID=UPI0020003FF2|nr:methyl-accepting chemotaxis protein [Paenibacillus pabuli]UPK45139.1 MCP four helix bundle domain-containing protein [Paenibacillus pabuli]
MEGTRGSVMGKLRFTIRMKLLTGFLMVVGLLAFVSIYALTQIHDMSNKADDVDKTWMPSVSLLGQMNGDISDVERLALAIIVEQDENETVKLNEALNQLLSKIEDERKQLLTFINSNEGAMKLYNEFSTNYEAYLAKMPAFIELGLKNDYNEASKLHTEAYSLWYTANDSIVKLIEMGNQGSDSATNASVESAEKAFNVILGVTIVAFLIAMFIAFFIASIISRPIQKMNAAAMLIANGDLTSEKIVLKNKDELGTLAESFNVMTGNLREMIQSVSMTSEQVAASSEELLASAEQNTRASEQISETVEELAVGTSDQVDIVKRSSQAMSEMALGSEQIAELAQSVSVSAVDAANQSAEGNMIIQQAVEQMGSVRNSIASLTELVTGLGERSAEIGTITEVINNIARQTNLLALNAAIEAARAGEHGRGFAVVAGEVRKLAEESSESAQKITDLVQLIQKDTDHAVQAVKVNSNETEAGIEIVTAAGQAFEQISNAVNKVAGEIQEVSAGSEEMSASTSEVVGYVGQISNIAGEAAGGVHNVSAATQQQLASMEEIASSAGSLSKMAEELQEQINKFRV